MNLEELIALIKLETGHDLTGEDFLAEHTDSLEYLQVILCIEGELGAKVPENHSTLKIKELLPNVQA